MAPWQVSLFAVLALWMLVAGLFVVGRSRGLPGFSLQRFWVYCGLVAVAGVIIGAAYEFARLSQFPTVGVAVLIAVLASAIARYFGRRQP